MKVWNKIKLFYKTQFNQRVTRDEHFNVLLRIFFILGFYSERKSASKIMFLLLKFTFIFLIILVGCIKNLFDSNAEGSRITSIVILFRFVILTSEFISIVMQQTRIKAMVEDFSAANVQDKTINELCSKAIRSYRRLFMAVGICLTVVHGILSENVHGFMPAVYNEFAQGYLMFLVNLIHYIVLVNLTIAIDLIPTVSILKLQAIVISLCTQTKEVTSGSIDSNEKRLDECISLHVDVIK